MWDHGRIIVEVSGSHRADVYYAAVPAKLHWAQLNSTEATDCPVEVVFHSQSGQTHLLDGPSAWIVRRLENSPLTRLDITSALVHEYGAEISTDDASRFVEHLLPLVLRMGLIETVRR